MSAITRHLRAMPKPAAMLGFAGAVPFVAGGVGTLIPALAIVGPAALLTYGAVILSFLGGVHWGLAMSGERASFGPLGASVVPSLVGWAALLIGERLGMILLALAFAGLLAFDLSLVRRLRAPAWYGALRRPLTLIVVTCLLLAAIAG